MRIASLVPSATEMLFALGLGESVVGVTHECDFPPGARELRGELEGRLAAAHAAVAGAPPPRVIALEWLDPPFVGGHWVPEMIALAGGEDVAGPAGAKSPEVEWEALAALDPDLVVVMPCGWYVEESRAQAIEHWERIEALGADRVFVVDAASTYSRPGPGLVDGTELLAHLLHPDLADPPGGIAFAELPAQISRS